MKKIILTTEQLNKISEYVSQEENMESDMNETIKSSSDELYRMQCDVDLEYHNVTYKGMEIDNIEVDGSIFVNFSIDLEHRSWGIKAVYVSVISGTETLPLIISYYPEGSEEYVEEEIDVPINWDSTNEESSELGYLGIDQFIDVKLSNNESGDIVIESLIVKVSSV